MSKNKIILPTFYEQKEYNDSMPDRMVRRGNFIWSDQSKLKVEFHDDPNGFFRVAWMPSKVKTNFPLWKRIYVLIKNQFTYIFFWVCRILNQNKDE